MEDYESLPSEGKAAWDFIGYWHMPDSWYPKNDLIRSLRENLEKNCKGTKCLIEFLLTEDIKKVGYCFGDVVSDTLPDEWMEELGIDLQRKKYGIFTKEGAKEYEQNQLIWQEIKAKYSPTVKERYEKWCFEFEKHYGEPPLTYEQAKAEEYFEKRKQQYIEEKEKEYLEDSVENKK